MGYLHVILTTS